MRLVLDTSALLSGRPFEGELFVTPEVLHEVHLKDATPQLEMFLEAKVSVCSPSPKSLAAVDAVARKTRDDRRISQVDRGLLALAHELEAAVATDDYSIQNLCTELGLEFVPVMQRGITQTIHWRYRCAGCRKYWNEWHDDCPDCGSKLRTSKDGSVRDYRQRSTTKSRDSSR